MRFTVRDFGPIQEANINTKPLTIFIGPNGTGKSYLLYLLWALYSAEPNFDKLGEMLGNKDLSAENLSDSAKTFLLQILNDPRPVFENLDDLLKKTFRVENSRELIRKGASKAQVKICNDQYKSSVDFELSNEGLGWKIYGTDVAKEKMRFKTEQLYDRTFLTMFWDGEKRASRDVEDNRAAAIASFIPPLFDTLTDGYAPFMDAFFALDGRGGLMRERETFVHEMLTTWRPPTSMSAPASAFIRSMESLATDNKNEDLARFADFLEDKLGIRYLLRREPPRYVIEEKDRPLLQTPIFRAPSGYRELASIVYAFRHANESVNSLIEEPEAHLHPDAQSIVARMLAGVARTDKAEILATTHEIRILDEVSNLLRLNKLSEEEKSKAGYEKWEGLSPEDVTIYFFSKDEEVKPVEVSEDGLDESGLDRVVLEIANTHGVVERFFRKREG